MRHFWSPLAIIIVALVAVPAAPAEEDARIGRQIPNFTLRDFHGKQVNLNDYKESRLIVVAFLGTDCPLVRLYGPRLDEISKKYDAKDLTVIGINSNRQDQPTKIGAYARIYGMSFPILKDPDSSIADVFGAIRTPEIFVLDKDRVVRYWGRVDDQYGFTTGVGYGLPKMRRNDLTDAVDELLAGNNVSVPVTKAPGCLIGRVEKVAPHGDVTYSNQIARILQDRCVECHREGEIAPFPLTSYEDVLGWGEMINEVVQQKRMPPWYANPEHGTFANDSSMSEDEKELLARWVANGQPEGDPADLPEPRQFAEGWGIPEPDAIFAMRDEPFSVPADGVIDYQYFTVDPGFTEDKWIQGVEARPGNHAVVHHIIVFIQAPGDDDGNFQRRGALIGYAPGLQARMYPKGYGIHVPAGSKLVFQLHYTAVGTPEDDLSKVGMIFADEDEIQYEVRGGVSGTMSFAIPPGAADHVVTAKRKLRRDTTIMSFMPHLHVRGTAFRYEAKYPDGTREILLDVPKYDFNWQLWYDLAEPKTLPKGTFIYTTAHYDNSEDNVYNPDPTAEVTYGDQTWDEMMFGWYTTIVPRDNSARLTKK